MADIKSIVKSGPFQNGSLVRPLGDTAGVWKVKEMRQATPPGVALTIANVESSEERIVRQEDVELIAE